MDWLWIKAVICLFTVAIVILIIYRWWVESKDKPHPLLLDVVGWNEEKCFCLVENH